MVLAVENRKVADSEPAPASDWEHPGGVCKLPQTMHLAPNAGVGDAAFGALGLQLDTSAVPQWRTAPPAFWQDHRCLAGAAEYSGFIPLFQSLSDAVFGTNLRLNLENAAQTRDVRGDSTCALYGAAAITIIGGGGGAGFRGTPAFRGRAWKGYHEPPTYPYPPSSTFGDAAYWAEAGRTELAEMLTDLLRTTEPIKITHARIDEAGKNLIVHVRVAKLSPEMSDEVAKQYALLGFESWTKAVKLLFNLHRIDYVWEN